MNKKKNTKVPYIVSGLVAIGVVLIGSLLRYNTQTTTVVQQGDIVDVYYTIQDGQDNVIQTNS